MARHISRLNSVSLPEESRFLRRIPKAKLDDSEFISRFDQHTFIYDAFFDSTDGYITLVTPPLRTQRRIFKALTIKIDGHRIDDLDIQHLSPRTNQIRFPSPNNDPKIIRILHPAKPRINVQSQLSRTDLSSFRDKNVLLAISKNNKLIWVKDWLNYHVKNHGANALVLIDNGSDSYDLEDLESTISSVQGIKTFKIISAPLPFGPKATDRVSTNAKFLHLSALHIAHQKYLKQANAVLSIDIDELVTKPGNRTIFEAAKLARQGFVSIKGSWRYASKPNDTKEIVRHKDHVLKRKGRDTLMQPKWCVDPTGPLRGHYWKTHGILRAERDFDHEFEYLHCRYITTNWDYDRDYEPDERFIHAQEADFIAKSFG